MAAGIRNKKLGNLRTLEPPTDEQIALKKRRKKGGMRLAPFYESKKGPAFEQKGRGTPPVAPKPKPKPKPKAKPFQRLSAREAAELKHSGVKYDGIPEGSVPATVMSSPKPGEGMSARDRAEMGMKKGGKVRGAGIAQRGVRAAKMR